MGNDGIHHISLAVWVPACLSPTLTGHPIFCLLTLTPLFEIYWRGHCKTATSICHLTYINEVSVLKYAKYSSTKNSLSSRHQCDPRSKSPTPAFVPQFTNRHWIGRNCCRKHGTPYMFPYFHQLLAIVVDPVLWFCPAFHLTSSKIGENYNKFIYILNTLAFSTHSSLC